MCTHSPHAPHSPLSTHADQALWFVNEPHHRDWAVRLPLTPTYHDHRWDVRPDVRCTFRTMQRCDRLFEGDDAQACREGVRDAHLLTYHPVANRAYEYGFAAGSVCDLQYNWY